MPNVDRRRYTPEERHRALQIFALNSGRPDLTRKMLDDNGLSVHVESVRKWTRADPDGYARVVRDTEAQITADQIEGFRENVSLAIDVQREALRQAQDALARGELDPKELLKVAKDSAVAGGISVDKSQLLSGQPTEIVGSAGDLVGETVRGLESIGVSVFVTGADGRQVRLGEDGKPVIDVDAKDDGEVPALGDGQGSGKDEETDQAASG